MGAGCTDIGSGIWCGLIAARLLYALTFIVMVGACVIDPEEVCWTKFTVIQCSERVRLWGG